MPGVRPITENLLAPAEVAAPKESDKVFRGPRSRT
jgi:hypothetical protein